MTEIPLPALPQPARSPWVTESRYPPDQGLTTEEKIQLGKQAARLLGDPLVKRAFEAIEWSYMNRWRNSRMNENEEREHLYRLWRCTQEARHYLTELVERGDIEVKMQEAANPEPQDGAGAAPA